MQGKQKAIIMDELGIERAITRISFEILERNKGVKNLSIVGIRRRGFVIAKRIAKKISEIEKIEIEASPLDITYYRDDNKERTKMQPPEEKLDVDEKNIILVDDVMFTGRTVRAAIDALMDCGRPKSISLAVMVDRGHRELPMRPDFVGKNVPTSKSEMVRVCVMEFDNKESITIEDK